MSTTVPQVALPEILPVFPLTGVMLLPGTVLPLHIFEPRYRAMVEDAIEADKIFGMIQPYVPQDDNRGPQPGAENSAPDLYRVGCAGLIEQWEKLPDGRFFVQLKGVNRFRVAEELALQRGYRRVKATYQTFDDASAEQNWRCNRSAVLEALAGYGKAHGMQVRSEQAEKFSDLELVNLLSVSLPLHPAEKQALLEAPGLQDRERMLVNLLQLGAAPLGISDEPTPRTLN
ncbi:MAG TPA: LON peptidase substrate-binding domain-containing protein [Candidatus Binatia bacterium]|jgi:Lon protease-like protein